MAVTVPYGGGGKDNLKRGVRTAAQVALGLLATGALSTVWDSYNKTHPVDVTVQVAMVIVLGGVASWAVNMLEDKTGAGFLIPKDRQVGDLIVGSGIGVHMEEKGLSKPAPGSYGTDMP